jgi:STE24 endopeptidase
MPEPQPISLAWTFCFAFALVCGMAVKFWLATRQIRHVGLNRNAVPPAFAEMITLAAHQKAAAYTIAKNRLGLLELALGSAMLIAWTLLGGLDALNQAVIALQVTWKAPDLLAQLALLVGFIAISTLVELPVSLYQTFVLEARFGFNKTSFRLWLQDGIKSIVVGLLIGLPIVALVLWLMGSAGPMWWLWAWAVWTGFNLLLMMVYPTFIAPLFNSFKPLEDDQLKARVTSLMQRCGFSAKGFFVMDGSKRSAHANAYFTGFGAARRVVFYDTLLAKLSPPEVDAVLAHELGHFKHKHILKRLVLMFGMSLGGFALLGWLSTRIWFFTGLGVQPGMLGANDALALILFMLVIPVFSFFAAPLLAQLSRSHEFQADAYAVAQTSGKDLSGALLKLYEDNASTLTPDPWYVRFYYSHPPASERLPRMMAIRASGPVGAKA